MKDYVIDKELNPIGRDVISVSENDIVKFNKLYFYDVREIQINQERNSESGTIVVFLVNKDKKEMATIQIDQKMEIVINGAVERLNDGMGRVIEISELDKNAKI